MGKTYCINAKIKLNNVIAQKLKRLDKIVKNSGDQMRESSGSAIQKIFGDEKWREIQFYLEKLGPKWKKIVNSLMTRNLENQKVSFKQIETVLTNTKSKDLDPVKIKQNIKENIFQRQQNKQSNEISQNFLDSMATFSILNDEEKINSFLDLYKKQILNSHISQFDHSKFQNFLTNNINQQEISHFQNKIQRQTQKLNPEFKFRFMDQNIQQKQTIQNDGDLKDQVIGQATALLTADEQVDLGNVNPDEELPVANSKEGGAPCENPSACNQLALLHMKNTMLRLLARYLYEILGMIVYVLATVTMGMCACVPTKPPPYYIDMESFSCNNKSSWPGIACTIPFNIMLTMAGFSFMVYMIMLSLTNLIKIPIGNPLITFPI